MAIAFGINNTCHAVGEAFFTSGASFRPTHWPACGAPKVLPGLSGGTSGTGQANGVNASRVSVGFVITTTNLSKPVRWPAFGAPSTLPGLSGGSSGTGAALGINGAGTIVGWSSTLAAGGDAHAVAWTS